MSFYVRKALLSSLFFFVFPIQSWAQIYSSANGHIWFFSEAPLENIEAHNQKVACALNTDNGELVFKITIDRFIFEKELMRKHFNENYIESEKYPYSTFKGAIENYKSDFFENDTSVRIFISGELSLHGVTKTVRETATLKKENDIFTGEALFRIRLEDYKIKIPKAVVKNIAEEVDVHVEVNLSPYKK